MDEPHLATRHYAYVTAALMALLVLTIAVSYLPLGVLSFPAAMAIAICKALLVALFFMHLRYENPLMRLFAVAGLGWLIILMSGTLHDYLTR
jgi:cytochrome c oxidase subunit 4